MCCCNNFSLHEDFILRLTVWGVEPGVTHQTSWLGRQVNVVCHKEEQCFAVEPAAAHCLHHILLQNVTADLGAIGQLVFRGSFRIFACLIVNTQRLIQPSLDFVDNSMLSA